MSKDLKYIYNQFSAKGEYVSGLPFGSGHINDTFLIKTQGKTSKNYILQKVNQSVFKNVPGIQENIYKLTSHLRKKLEKIPGSNPARETLTIVPARDNKPYFKDNEGNYWRVFEFIDKAHSYDKTENPLHAFECGKAFGRFQFLLSDMNGEELTETIPEFHNIYKRLKTYRQTVSQDPVKRVQFIKTELEFVEEHFEKMSLIQDLGAQGKIPLRITHNDTKINNVLFDNNERAICIIDLDTVMPGYIHFDFGDSIRTITNTGDEDEEDLSKVSFNIKLFEAYARGFLGQTKTILIPNEIETLAFSALFMAFIMGLRFLTDYIDGDNYYKIQYPIHNLTRARAQFKLLGSMELQFKEMQKLVMKISKVSGKL